MRKLSQSQGDMRYEDVPRDIGAKKRDYWWTVLFVDPLAFPATRFLARKRWLTPNQVTWISFAVGAPMGIFFAQGTRLGLVIGGILWYLAFFIDCIDGKLARAMGISSPMGKVLDEIADGGRRLSGAIGLTIYLASTRDDNTFYLAVAYGLLAFYFGQISGGTRPVEPATTTGSRWSMWLARRRLLPTPGAPDIAAIVFLVGPVTGMVVPALWIGDVAFAVGSLIVMVRAARAS